jgi:hypothetical protein
LALTPCREEWCEIIGVHPAHEQRTVRARELDEVRRQTAATRIGVTLSEYDARQAAGEKWCKPCRAWHPREAFSISLGRWDGLKPYCAEVERVRARAYWQRRTGTGG